jgi:hypothetical protein
VWGAKGLATAPVISRDEASPGYRDESAPLWRPSKAPEDGTTPGTAMLLQSLFDAELERDALRREVAELRAVVSSAAAADTTSAQAGAGDETGESIRKKRKEALLARWKEIAQDPSERADAHLREMFTDFGSDLDAERSIDDLRALFRSYCEGYRPYRSALESFNDRSRHISNAVELRRAVEDLRREERRILDFVVPHLTAEERRAFDLR